MVRVAVWNEAGYECCRIMRLGVNTRRRLVGESDDDFLRRIVAEGNPTAPVPSIIDDTDLPADRYFRNAWEWSN